MINNDDECDAPFLSETSLKALQEFLAEQSLKETSLHNYRTTGGDILSTTDIDENWQLSQFWYDEKTAEILANEIHRAAGESGKIALISCPTLYKYVKKLCTNNEIKLLEFDKRFSMYDPDFIFYDYNKPHDVSSELIHQFDIVVLDPPFLSEECLEKTADTAKFLSKDKIILCTGAIMEEHAKKLLNLEKCQFQPRHKNNLANEFFCFSNYNFDNFVNHDENKEGNF